MNLHNCALAQFQKLSNNPERIYVLQSEFEVMKNNIAVLVIENDMEIPTGDGNPSFTADDAAVMLVSSCIAPARN